jgi:hypothetical protein
MNDLIGLPYCIGAKYSGPSSYVDCFSLFVEARKRLGLPSYEDEFAWVYDELMDDLPIRKILAQVKTIAYKQASPEEGDLAVLSLQKGHIGLGVFVNNGILTIARHKRSFWSPHLIASSFWHSFTN